MTDNCDDKCEINNSKEVDNVDSDKSFESCVYSVADGVSNVLIKDDDSERSFQSCSNNNQEKTEDSDKKENVELINSNHEDDDEDDDIRPGSCRENPSSDEETSSWDENKDNWIYDVEYLKEAESKTQLPEAETTEHDFKLCKEDLEYIIENHVTKDNNKPDNQFNEINNPTFIPTNGKFYMHDLRLDDSNDEVKKTNKNQKIFQSKSNETWKHDLYIESKQKPISKGELINKYGADIRQKNDFQEIKENKFKRNYRTNVKRYNYRRSYYEYEYDYDYYDSYYGYYYGGDGYYDYNYYGSQYNSWNRPYRDFNRNQLRSEYKNYKTNSPEVKPKRSSKPPSKYSQMSEYTDIKITVNLDNFGSRQIENISNNSNKNQNSNFRRLDGFSTDENLDSAEPCNHSTPKNDQRESDATNKKCLSDVPKRKGPNNPLPRNHGENRKPGNIPSKRTNYPPFQRNFVEPHHGENNAPHQRHYGKPQQKFVEPNYNNEYERTQGKSQLLSYRSKQNVPDWANTKYEWDANCDFKDVIEEMPPLTEKEINQLQKRPMNSHNPPPPRFTREKSAPQFVDNKTNQNIRTQTTFVPKRYSELRNQSEPPPQSSPTQSHTEPPPPPLPHPPQIINYQQMIPSLEYYNNLQPLLLNMNPHHHHSASANSPQQSSSNTFSSMHHPHPAAPPPPPHMVSLSSLIQPGSTAGTAFDNNNQQQFYIHPLYLPAATATVGRLNQFSQPFQPSYVSQTTAYPTHSSATSTTSTTCNTPNNVSQNTRPVLGRS